MKRFYLLILVSSALIIVFACKKEDNKKPEPPIPYSITFAKGADVSWTTEMESKGVLFYDKKGVKAECMSLMKSLGMNSIRLRVWVNPSGGWNNKTDVFVKAKRAKDLGLRIMIDFHYSDTWADPGHQTKPVAWQSLQFNDLKAAISSHTTEVLAGLKNLNITPEWVQVGNETGNGMLWEEGKAATNMAQYAALNNAGYDAVKSVFPNTKAIVHLHAGQDNSLYRWLFDGLKQNNGRWDVIGMSLYPEPDKWLDYNTKCIENINDMISRYSTEVMICEVGMSWDKAATAKLFLTDLITKAKAISNEKCLGVFYWEPQAHSGWNGYTLGAFDNTGKPTEALDAFK